MKESPKSPPQRPTFDEISLRAKRLVEHVDQRVDQEVWVGHLESVVDDLYALSQNIPLEDDAFGILRTYPGYTSEDFATLLEELVRLEPSVAKHLTAIQAQELDK